MGNQLFFSAPPLRFEEFKDEWKEASLGDLVENFEYGLNASSKEYDGKNKYLRITDINEVTRKFSTNNLTSPNVNLSLSSNYILEERDVLFARTGASVGKTYIYEKTDGIVYFAGFLIRARIKKDHNPQFVFQNTLTSNYNNFVKVTSQRSGQPGINAQEYSNYRFKIPGLNEQEKIGLFLKKFDDMISLHQQELEALKQTKQGFLQKMFPKKGESLPQLRFKEFDRPWSDCKLKNLGEIKTGATPSTGDIDNYSKEGMLWITPTDIKGMVTKNSAKKLSLKGQEKARIVEPYSILVTSIASIGKNTMVEGYASFNQQINSLTPFKSNDSYFLLTQSYFWSKEMKNKAALGTMQIVNKSEFSEMSFLVPEKKEQVKIGEFFRQLDEVIELKEKELKVLMETKKGFLQKMFV